MNEESSPAQIQHNVSRMDSAEAFAIDGENIARVEGGQHAVSESAQAECSCLSKNLDRKIISGLIPRLAVLTHGRS